jgi:hypothetical protein
VADLYAGISGLTLNTPEVSLGYGVVLRQTYAYLFSSHMVAFSPAMPGQPHPGPWQSANGGIAYEITAELFIPEKTTNTLGNTDGIAHSIAFTLRLGVNPATSLAVFSNRPLTASAQSSDKRAWITSVEIECRRFPLTTPYGVLDEATAKWAADRWPTLLRFSVENSEFALMVDALNLGQYIHRPSLTMVSLWAALEALFSPSTSELKFRVSLLIAAYLEPPGESRQLRAKSVSKLYDKRSSAAHGKPSKETSPLLDTFNLAREVIIKILNEKRIPTKQDLENNLYGVARE